MSETEDRQGSVAGEAAGADSLARSGWYGGETESPCYGCHLCGTRCTAAQYGVGFDPRDIMLRARFGLTETLLWDHSALWQCFGCEGCRDFCPQSLAPVDVIEALKRRLVERVFDWGDR